MIQNHVHSTTKIIVRVIHIAFRESSMQSILNAIITQKMRMLLMKRILSAYLCAVHFSFIVKMHIVSSGCEIVKTTFAKIFMLFITGLIPQKY